MPIHVALSHRTSYSFDRLVGVSPHVIRLRPAPHCRTPILSYSLTVTPQSHFVNWQQDPHGNYLARLVFPDPSRELLIEVDLIAELSVFNPFDFFLESSAESFPFEYDTELQQALAPYLEQLPAGPKLREWVAAVDLRRVRTIDFVVGLNRRLARDISYIIRLEPGVQTPEETLTRASGSCRDTGWLLVQILRQLGLAARFVSGYLIQLTPDVKALDGPTGAATDFTDLHAWVEVYLPGAGWIGLDPTSGLLAGEGHIPLAATPGYGGAAPVTGAVDECEVAFGHEMTLTRIYESPRVTKPYTEDQWRRIEACGRDVDRELSKGDVRLTMGGEPTFVSLDDVDGAEWNVDAMGPRKRGLGGVLVRRLKKQFAPGALLHFGQGKWYPGEPLPRWALGCWWRRDGVPMWKDDSLIADETVDYGYGEAQAKRFIDELADRLGVATRFAIPAYEDVWHYLWKERRLPVNVDPLKSELENELERERLSRIFEQGIDRVVGYVLPLHRIHTPDPGAQWASGAWFLRSEHLFLIPGDSPLGYRLPLDSLPWVEPGKYPHLYEADPCAPAPPLPPRQPSVPGRTGAVRLQDQVTAQRMPTRGESAAGVVRTAVCIEPRHGRLHVFMPPLESTEDYLDLIAAIEATASTLVTPVVIEGETPPSDRRLNHIKVTPDPGVIEVNMQPAHSWDELVTHTTVLYDEARLTRLGTEKFMLDGRHTGTGGGNHIVIGGPTAADSPILRRPDLLRSLVGYWHNHPSMSYLFSGLFLGPTSQHPRVDEARNDALHELEIAFARIAERDSPPPPWLVDRLFRNLLIDVTGNTHRAEFCIDKLYDPENSSGRQGLVELRAFEMPPHARMSLTQQLLLRALIARFWKTPYNQALVRWGTELHDRFMLPHFIAQDFDDVVQDLSGNGYGLETAWFAPHLEFRFPLYGTVTRRGVHFELRQALEPWHVMGEEAGAGGTVRYVDSSVERLQVKVSGMTGTRHLVTCNGRRVPLHPTGTVGEFVAGVRYRAWQPPSGLHPTIPVQAPLVFDILDTWNDRSVGGCVYHVTHPGGRYFDVFPINAYEAESRRLARFFDIGHSPGRVSSPDEERDRDFPLTLDMRTGRSAGDGPRRHQ
ncbi:MAG TPA: transglutaminase family protein [Vicinamibacterales bacterium]|nr:transglutaminase family protein [Vicinamibacterales bacterium]